MPAACLSRKERSDDPDQRYGEAKRGAGGPWILLLPLGIPLGAFALSLYGKAAQLLSPGSSRFEQLVARGEGALRRHGKQAGKRLHLTP